MRKTCWIRGEDRGALMHRSRAIETATGDALKAGQAVDGFRHREGRELGRAVRLAP